MKSSILIIIILVFFEWQSVQSSIMVKMKSATEFELSEWKNYVEVTSPISSSDETVQLDINADLADFNFDDLLIKFSKIETISTGGSFKVDKVTYPSNPAPTITSLTIKQITGFDNIDLAKFPNIKCLQVSGNQIDNAFDSLKNSINSLTNLELKNTSLKQIDCTKFPTLQECSFFGFPQPETVIFNCPNLDYLEVNTHGEASNDQVKTQFIGLENSIKNDFISDLKARFKNVTFKELSAENLAKLSVKPGSSIEESLTKKLEDLQSSLKTLRDRLDLLSNSLAALKKQLGSA